MRIPTEFEFCSHDTETVIQTIDFLNHPGRIIEFLFTLNNGLTMVNGSDVILT